MIFWETIFEIWKHQCLFFMQDVWFGGDADYDNIQTTTIDSNSSIDVTVGQNNFGNKIPMYYGRKRKTRKRRRQQAKIGWTREN